MVPKEIYVIDLATGNIAHWIVAPVTPIDSLSRSARIENNWLTLHHHGIDYFDGDVTKKAISKSLSEISKRVRKVYVRGKEKCLFLNRNMSREIINLEYDKNCPSFANLPWSDQHCLYHALEPSHLSFSCALNNAQRLRHYLLQNTENVSRSPEMEDFVQNSTNLCDDKPFTIGQSTYTSFESDEEILIKDEQPGAIESVGENSTTYDRGIPSRSDPQGMDETDSFYF